MIELSFQGFSHGEVIWHYLIAIYLLLAGISGGSVVVSLLIKFYTKQTQITNLYRSAALISCLLIILGMFCLVIDLHRPLYFWKILLNYNLTSVMSLGVISLLIYIPLTCFLFIIAFDKVILSYLPFAKSFAKIIFDLIVFFKKPIEILSLIFGVIICAYTGFLISVLVRFPLLNTSILPALFVASGFGAGLACIHLLLYGMFKEPLKSKDMKILHSLELPIMLSEILLLFMLYASLLSGNALDQQSANAFNFSLFWGKVFWIGVVGFGFVLPFVNNFLLSKKISHQKAMIYFTGFSSVIGVFSLRLFILYAGQSFGI